MMDSKRTIANKRDAKPTNQANAKIKIVNRLEILAIFHADFLSLLESNNAVESELVAVVAIPAFVQFPTLTKQ